MSVAITPEAHSAIRGSPPAMSAPPHVMFRQVRTRLLDDLQQASGDLPKVISIVAPIGYGKTVLMAELYADRCQRGEHCVWVGLDERDVSADRVLLALGNALARPAAEAHPTQTLFRGGTTSEGRTNALIDVIGDLPAPVAIFIDNLNGGGDAELGALLDALVFSTPAHVRFIWSSTTAPGFNFGRAKLEGLVRQVGFADLSLDASETGELLGPALTARLGGEGIETLRQRTEGWPAATRMAQIVLTDAEQPAEALAAFSGAHEDIAELLNRQALRGFSGELRTFLLGLAELRTFDRDLCRHALGADAGTHLDVLIRRNIFIVPLDRNRQRYRLHGLLRQYLLGEAKRSLDAGNRLEILQRAAEWCERTEQWRDAIDYALAAERPEMASRILECAAAAFVRERGDVPQFVLWVEQLRAEHIDIGWETHFWYVWALVFRRRYELSREQQEALTERLRAVEPGDAPPPADLAQRNDHLRMCIDLFCDRPADTLARAEHWLSRYTNGDAFAIGSVGGLKAFSLASAFRFNQAQQTMRVAEPFLRQAGSNYFMGWITLGYALPSIFAGDYAYAYGELQTGLIRIRAQLGENTKLGDIMALLAAKCAVEMGLDNEAGDWLQLGLRSVHNGEAWDSSECTACGFDAAIQLWNGEPDTPVPLPRLKELAGNYPPRLALMTSCFLTRRLLRLGRVKEALAEAGRIGLVRGDGSISPADAATHDAPRYREILAATAIDLMLATDQLKTVMPLITTESTRALAEGRIARLVELGLTKMTLAMHRGRTAAAAKELALAICRATQGQAMRPFSDHAESIAELINDTKLSSWSFPLQEERDFFSRVCGGLPITNLFLQQRAQVHGGEPSLALTRREEELLSLIELGLSNKQMTDHTDISVGTIKWHLKNLYKKLGVTNRSAALARVRAQHQLHR